MLKMSSSYALAMRKFLILTNSLSERADSVNALELIRIVRDHLGSDCILAFSSRSEPNPNRLALLKGLSVPFIFYSSRYEIEKFSKFHQATHTIAFSGGGRRALDYCSEDGRFRIGENSHITQAVFKTSDFHGELFLFVSEWLYRARPMVSRLKRHEGVLVDFLPHAVADNPEFLDLPQALAKAVANRPYIARVGGRDQFSDPAAQRGIIKFLDENPDYVFVAINTDHFSDHERVIYFPYLERGEIWTLYRHASAALNGRRMGESFGYSIFEPLAVGTPVVAPHPIRNPLMDKNHAEVLAGSGLLYYSTASVSGKLQKAVSGDWTRKSEIFSKVENSRRKVVAERFEMLLERRGL